MAVQEREKTTREERVDNAPFRELVLETIRAGDATWNDLAVACGYERRERSRGWGDSTKLQRVLGCRTYSKKGKHYFQKRITYELAVRIVRACDAWPAEYGI